MRELARAFLAEPQVENPPRRVWRDWVLFGVVIVSGVLEGVLRPDVLWRGLAIAMCLGLSVVLLHRRTHPLLMVAVTLITVNLIEVASLVLNDGRSVGLYTTAYLLIVVYAPFRWGSGRDAIITLAMMAVVWALGFFSVDNSTSDMIGGAVVFLLPAALGLEVRYYLRSRQQQVEQGRLLEREQLARELHDTVAHYVSAIAIQAQAGLALADVEPEAAKEALRTVEEAASRTLVEMRSMVGALRTGETAELAPQARAHDIPRLAREFAGGPSVSVQLEGGLDELRPVLDATLYRLAQESITNALRHAKNASSVMVSVLGRANDIELLVTDDGSGSLARSAHVPGFGMLGMAERVALLGGTFSAGPDAAGGWTTRAVLPRRSAGG